MSVSTVVWPSHLMRLCCFSYFCMVAGTMLFWTTSLCLTSMSASGRRSSRTTPGPRRPAMATSSQPLAATCCYLVARARLAARPPTSTS
eukprot:scaffold144484_cov40-Prasinocladus_malaysianus.AAC.1